MVDCGQWDAMRSHREYMASGERSYEYHLFNGDDELIGVFDNRRSASKYVWDIEGAYIRTREIKED